MKRTTVIQEIINKKNFKKYLEIGTHKGMSLFPLKCKCKIAIDPSFRISKKEKINWLFKNPTNFRNKYFELTSDDFFKSQKKFLEKVGKQEVIFIDGLHTYNASLKDVLNSLKYLKENGVIVMHDCLPPHKAASIPLNSFEEGSKDNIEGWTGEWCGDVWKSIVYLKRKYKQDLEVFVLDTDYGLGIIKFSSAQKLNFEIDIKLYNSVNSLTFENLIENPKELIDLKDKAYFSTFLESL